MEFKNKVAIVIGGSRGIGRAIALRLAAAGARVVVAARDAAALEEAAREASSRGLEVLTAKTDVVDRTAVEALVADAVKKFGRLDIMVNTAAVHGPIGPFIEADPEAFERTVAANLFGAANSIRVAAAAMIKNGGGRILLLGGGGAVTPRPMLSAYAASKAAIVRLVETAALELKAAGVEVNVLAPGAINTRLTEELAAAGPEILGDEHDQVLNQLARGGDSIAAAAETALFLVSDRARGLTGRVISAKWDDLAGLEKNISKIAETDLYTLRRIVPRDRGMTLGQ